MEAIETMVGHQWKPLEEYKLEETKENAIEGIKKMKPNQYFILSRDGTVEHHNSILEELREKELDIGKGENCEYGWKMPLIGKRRELRVFKRY